MSEEQKKRDEEIKEIRFEERKDSSGTGFGEYLKKNKRSLAVVIVVAVVLLGAGVLLGTLIGKSSGSEEPEVVAATEETTEEQTQETAAVPDVPLEENAYPQVNELIEKYYRAAAAGDVDTINTLKDYSEQTELLQIQEKSKYLEGYEDINCYTKPGPVENSYVVYVSYYAVFRDVEQKVCGLNTYVVCTSEDGSCYIHDCSQDEEMREYRTNVTKQDDVVELFNRIQVEYNETVTENEELAAFLTELSDNLKTAVGEALAEMETAAQTETENTEPEGQEAADAAGDGAGTVVEATDVVNVRKSDSETADVLAKAQVGEQFTLLENKANGWSRVEYDGEEAYIKSEFLSPVSDGTGAEEQADGQGEADEQAGQDEQAGNTDEGQEQVQADTPSDVPDSGTYRLTDTVNIRVSASETADRLGVGYSGDEVEIVMKQADGWTKVVFKGETGYIRTDVLK